MTDIQTVTNNNADHDYYLNGDGQIEGDVRHLLDFAILGFAKSATTYLVEWFHQQSNDISISSKEICFFNKKDAPQLIRHLTQTLDGTKLRGFKCPSHFTRSSLDWYRRYFPQTKLIIGVRHPVLWFQSFYNFRIRHPKYPKDPTIHLPSPKELIGSCTKANQGLCTSQMKFHSQLARLGKTPLNATERTLVHLNSKDLMGLGMHRVENPVFLYEITQIRNNPAQMAHDLAKFLGMEQPLKSFVGKPKRRHKPQQQQQQQSSPSSTSAPRELQQPQESKNGNNHSSSSRSKTISICDPQYDEVRQQLMKVAVEASEWILGYFMEHVTITTSPRASFVKALQAWKRDPCAAANGIIMPTTKTLINDTSGTTTTTS